MSFGVAELDSDGTAETLVGRADAALYASKETGRNRVTLSLPGDGGHEDIGADTAQIAAMVESTLGGGEIAAPSPPSDDEE
jgi:predicted signal transduction protein with EAL and GGDEF domain